MNTSAELSVAATSTQPIAKFRVLTDEELPQLRAALDLKMSVGQLRYCQQQYKLREMRDPYAEEIRLLDALLQAGTCKPAATAVAEVFCEDDFIMETYNDLLEKRNHIVAVPSNRMLTLEDLITIAPEYLSKISKVDALTLQTRFYAGRHSSLRLATEGFEPQFQLRTIPDTAPFAYGERTSRLDFQEGKARVGDLFLVLLDSAKTGVVGEDFAATFGRFTASTAFREHTNAARILNEKGLLIALADMADGVYLDPETLLPLEQPILLPALAGCLEGCVVVAVPSEDADRYTEIAEYCGLGVLRCAKSLASSKLSIRHDHNTPFAIETGFLRALAALALPYSAEIRPSSEAGYQPAVPETLAEAEALFAEASEKAAQSGYLLNADSRTLHPKELFGVSRITNGRLFAAAVTEEGSAPYLAALRTMIRSVAAVIAAGIDRRMVSLAIEYAVPQTDEDPEKLGDVLSQILGIYRGLTEFAIRYSTSRMMVYDDITPRVTVWSTSKLPDHLPDDRFTPFDAAKPLRVYYLEPLQMENGLPDFTEVKNLFDYVSALPAADGTVAVSACNNVLYAELKRMCGEAQGIRLEPSALRLLGRSVAGSFIVVSSEPIHGEWIGTLCEEPGILCGTERIVPNQPSAAPEEPESEIAPEDRIVFRDNRFSDEVSEEREPEPNAKSRHHVPNPVVCVPVFRGCGNLNPLKGFLESHESVYQIFGTETESSWDRFAEKIGDAQILILCGTEEQPQLLSHPRFLSALSDFLAGDGILFCCGITGQIATWKLAEKSGILPQELEDCQAPLGGHVYRMPDEGIAAPVLAEAIAYYQ